MNIYLNFISGSRILLIAARIHLWVQLFSIYTDMVIKAKDLALFIELGVDCCSVDKVVEWFQGVGTSNILTTLVKFQKC